MPNPPEIRREREQVGSSRLFLEAYGEKAWTAVVAESERLGRKLTTEEAMAIVEATRTTFRSAVKFDQSDLDALALAIGGLEEYSGKLWQGQQVMRSVDVGQLIRDLASIRDRLKRFTSITQPEGDTNG